ncbi:MAG: nicotinamide riboside transporter PnuC [Pseudomonadota bacterium]
MQALLDSLLSLEGVAVVLALAYLLLAARESLWCWLCALISSAIYMWLMWEAKLYMETVLNFFYVVMAVLGWWQWKPTAVGKPQRAIVSMRWSQHAICIGVTLALTLVNGWLIQRFTDAAWPFVDSFISWGCVVTTVLVVRKVLENWLYWIVLDGLAVVVYLDRELYLTALLFAGYVVIVVFGYFKWRREYLAAASPRMSGIQP